MAPSTTWLEFCDTLQGKTVLTWETEAFSRFVARKTGDVALQIGIPEIDAMKASTMGLNILLEDRSGSMPSTPHEAVFGTSEALPIASDVADLVVWPHGLDQPLSSRNALLEIVRVLVDEGILVTTFFNRCGTWQVQCLIGQHPRLPEELTPLFIRDAKRLLTEAGLHIEAGAFGVYGVTHQAKTTLWIEQAGDRWWPTLSNLVILVARKVTPGHRLVGKVNFANAAPLRASQSLANGSVGRNMKSS